MGVPRWFGLVSRDWISVRNVAWNVVMRTRQFSLAHLFVATLLAALVFTWISLTVTTRVFILIVAAPLALGTVIGWLAFRDWHGAAAGLIWGCCIDALWFGCYLLFGA